ncbi:peptidoglycan DD-metalloendopeptidase family protein [Chitinophaga rhizophila]|uniref:Peptidoglycan DD-metalloendopeptidase family protein n=1 Tax=Chitinophaga rhizophila TaxID=2866212 RepID=A0ABS7GFY1_9BACT|nr:peptidoglycan DD-metalloendopeptidase family protein [Chitinophaga rhizophila]MBW8686599.1 peptidoglycan DD-metalloendopeptidase family protein [Chitinophaga rhizophila]
MLDKILERYQPFQPVVLLDPEIDRLLLMDFTERNTSLTPEIIDNTGLFSNYVDQLLKDHECTFGIGGYAEHRTIYSRNDHFSTAEEPRGFHLAIDIWGPTGTHVFAPMDGTVHSFRFNDAHGDYGATIILQHQLEGYTFHTLYGHLSLKDLEGLHEGMRVAAGQLIAHFGDTTENGHWPPHLHFQIIIDMEGKQGDYPGVCRYSQREQYLANCPDPDLILQLMP